MIPLRARMELGAMAIKGYSSFPKALALLEPYYQVVLCHILDTRWWRAYSFAEKQCVSYSPADWDNIWFAAPKWIDCRECKKKLKHLAMIVFLSWKSAFEIWILTLSGTMRTSGRLVFMAYPYLPTPPLGQDMIQGQFFKRSLTGLNSEFSFS